MELQVNTIVIQCINFVLFAVIMYFFLFKPLQKVLAERREKISKDFDEAKAAKSDAEKLRKEYEEKLKQTSEESADIIANAVTAAETMKSDIIAEAHSAAERIKAKSEAEIADMKNKAYLEMNHEMGSLAVSLAGKLLESSLDENSHRAIVETFTAKVESGDVR